MAKNDFNMMLRLPKDMKRAIEGFAGQGRVSEFIRQAIENQLTTVCSRCHGSGRVPRRLKNKSRS